MKVRHVEPSATSPSGHHPLAGSSGWQHEVDGPRARLRATGDPGWADPLPPSDEQHHVADDIVGDDPNNDSDDDPGTDADGLYVVAYTRWLLGEIDWSVTGWMARYRVRLIQLALGVIFFWFGGLKLVPGLSPAEELVVSTANALLSPIGVQPPGRLVIVALALFEVAIGIGFLLDRHRKAMVWMLILHMFSTALPLFLLPEIAWTHAPYALTLEGQYIVKNLVILAGVATIGATLHAGYLNWAPPQSESDEAIQEDQTPPEPPRVWIVDETGSLVATYELDGYYGDRSQQPYSG